MKFVKSSTKRGFSLAQFYDDNDVLCDIQKSSAASKDMIWVGPHDANPQIMASKTAKGGTGWVDYEIPNDIFINHRMHLTRKQSIRLAIELLKFGIFNNIF